MVEVVERLHGHAEEALHGLGAKKRLRQPAARERRRTTCRATSRRGSAISRADAGARVGQVVGLPGRLRRRPDSRAIASTTKSTGTRFTVPRPRPMRTKTPGDGSTAPSRAGRSTGRRTSPSPPSASRPPRCPAGRSAAAGRSPDDLDLGLELRLLVVVLEALAHVQVRLAEVADGGPGDVGGRDVVEALEASSPPDRNSRTFCVPSTLMRSATSRATARS